MCYLHTSVIANPVQICLPGTSKDLLKKMSGRGATFITRIIVNVNKEKFQWLYLVVEEELS